MKVLVGLGVVVAVGWVLAKRETAARAEADRQRTEDTALIVQKIAELEEMSRIANLSPQARRTLMITETWDDFDRLPDKVRGRPMLAAFSLKAQQVMENLPDADVKELQKVNGEEMRKRVPLYMVAGEEGKASGWEHRTISPSLNQERCLELSHEWIYSPQTIEELQAYGFVRFACGTVNVPVETVD